MIGPDVRWEGVSHEQIFAWVSEGLDPRWLDALSTRLTSLAEALNTTADLKNMILQRINSGEWSSSAATLAAQAMQVLRDFDDTMGHRSETNNLAVCGQADNAAWARANVPPVVGSRVIQVPTGNPIDVLNSTVDQQHELRAAKDAEEQARQVMRQYQAMTVDRIAALPPLAPAPQVVVDGGNDKITVGSGPDQRDQVAPRDTPPAGDTDPDPRPGTDGRSTTPLPTGPGVDPLVPGPPAGTEPTDHERAGNDPAGTHPSRIGSPAVAGGQAFTVDLGGTSRAPGVPVGEVIANPGQPGSATPRIGERGGQSGFGSRAGTTEVMARGSTRGGPTGVTPIGANNPARSGEDKEHQVKYGVPGSEIFEPDSNDGLLFDPFRPGSFVAPSSIGDDDNE